MDIASIRTKAADFIRKYRYVVLILLIGLVLMALPTGNNKQSVSQSAPEQVLQQQTVNEELAEILSKLEGAGKVQVLLTIASGEETVYQTNDDMSVSENSNTTQIDTVTVTDADRNQTGLVKQINPPVYQGAIIVCQGADSATVRLAIVDAVSKVTGLSSDHISVLKMK